MIRFDPILCVRDSIKEAKELGLDAVTLCFTCVRKMELSVCYDLFFVYFVFFNSLFINASNFALSGNCS